MSRNPNQTHDTIKLRDAVTGNLTAYALSSGLVQKVDQDGDNHLSLSRDNERQVYVLSGKVEGVAYEEDFRYLRDARRMMEEATSYFSAPSQKAGRSTPSRADEAAQALRGMIDREVERFEPEQEQTRTLKF